MSEEVAAASGLKPSECADCPLVEPVPGVPMAGRCGWEAGSLPLWIEGQANTTSRYVSLMQWAGAPVWPCAAKAATKTSREPQARQRAE